MRDSTKMLVATCVLISLPLGYTIQFWSGERVSPLPVTGQDPSYYVIWAVVTVLVYVIPIILLSRALRYLIRRLRSIR